MAFEDHCLRGHIGHIVNVDENIDLWSSSLVYEEKIKFPCVFIENFYILKPPYTQLSGSQTEVYYFFNMTFEHMMGI